MIAIVDGGSTKCDWVIIKPSGNEECRTQSIGFNPNIIQHDLINQEVAKNSILQTYRHQVTKIYFYGSGCGTAANCQIVASELKLFFKNAEVSVKEDLLAAAYAAYNGNPALVCILGTGSNACGFDGKKLQIKLPSLGYIIGDEGGGCALGKRLLKNYFMEKLPSDLKQKFDEKHPLDIQTALQKMFHNTHTNAFFASYNAFISENISHPFLQNLVYEEFSEFFNFQVLPQLSNHTIEVNFVGSIAFIYQDILKVVAAKYHVKIGKIVQKPIDELVKFHLVHSLIIHEN